MEKEFKSIVVMFPYPSGNGLHCGHWYNGIRRFIYRMKEWMSRTGEETIDLEKFKKQIFDYTESFKFNKVVSSFMVLLNENKSKNLTEECKEEIIELANIYMPNFRAKMSDEVK